MVEPPPWEFRLSGKRPSIADLIADTPPLTFRMEDRRASVSESVKVASRGVGRSGLGIPKEPHAIQGV
jgi:hypothetical protein